MAHCVARCLISDAMRYILVMRGSKPWLVHTSAAIALLAACGVNDELPGGRVSAGGVIEGVNTTGRGAGTGAETGLPCDVQQVLENHCLACHLGTSEAGLRDYAELLSPAPSDSTKTLAALSLELMKSTTRPMPPAPGAPASTDAIAAFESWIAAGTPKGASCTGGPSPTANVYDTPTKCTSNKVWTDGEEGSERMKPGGACIACHTLRGKKRFSVAGTVYPSAHEPDDCNGVAGVTVEITDKNGKVTALTVNSVGNFELKETAVPAPFRVKVKSGTKERVMVGALTSGDCNSCHTTAGTNGAPGRVMAP